MAIDLKKLLADAEDEFPENSNINTTPLVDIMLVMLIIFLITVPVIVPSAKVALPNESNIATQTKPENIVIAVDINGDVFWNQAKLNDEADLLARLAVEAVKKPQPEVHIRGDKEAPYEYVGRVVEACQRSSIMKVNFITEPKKPGGG